MKLIIIRHGDPDYEHDSLTQKGVREAQLLSDRISQLDVKAFYCSPLGRAQDTASYTLNKMNRTAETLPWLCEFEGKIVSGLKLVSCWDRLPSVWTKYPEHYDYDNWYKSKIMRYGTVERKYKNVCEGIDELLKSTVMSMTAGYIRLIIPITIPLFFFAILVLNVCCCHIFFLLSYGALAQFCCTSDFCYHFDYRGKRKGYCIFSLPAVW